MVNQHKEKCLYCGKMFLPGKMAVHLKYFCGPDAVLTDKQRRTDRKEEAVKIMMIGGQESGIALAPGTNKRQVKITISNSKKKSQCEDYFSKQRLLEWLIPAGCPKGLSRTKN